MYRCSLVITVILLLSAVSLVAQQTKKASSDSDAIETAAKKLAGNWQCRGKSFSADGASSGYTYRMNIQRVLLGHWLCFAVVLTPDGARTPKLEAEDWWGLDLVTGEIAETFFDSRGSTGRGRVDVLNESQAHYSGEGGEVKEPFYQVFFDYAEAGKLHIRYQASADGKSWQLRTEDRCTKIKTR